MQIRTILAGIIWTVVLALAIGASVEDSLRLTLWCVIAGFIGAVVTAWHLMHHVAEQQGEKVIKKLNRSNRRVLETVAREIADAMDEREEVPRRIR